MSRLGAWIGDSGHTFHLTGAGETKRRGDGSLPPAVASGQGDPGRLALATSLGVFMFPFFWMISSSLKTLREVSVFPPPVLPETPQWENYTVAFERAPLMRYGLNSLIVCVAVILGVIVLSLLASYALVFLDFRLKGVVFLALLAPQMVAPVSLMLPLFMILHRVGLLNTLPALIIPYTVLYSPFAIFCCGATCRACLGTSSRPRVDGASDVDAHR